MAIIADRPKYPSGTFEDLKARTISYMKRSERYVYIGEVSLELRTSLKEAEWILTELEDQNLVKRMTKEEKASKKYHPIAELFCLI